MSAEISDREIAKDLAVAIIGRAKHDEADVIALAVSTVNLYKEILNALSSKDSQIEAKYHKMWRF